MFVDVFLLLIVWIMDVEFGSCEVFFGEFLIVCVEVCGVCKGDDVCFIYLINDGKWVVVLVLMVDDDDDYVFEVELWIG